MYFVNEGDFIMENEKLSKLKALLKIIIVLLVFFGICMGFAMIGIIIYAIHTRSLETVMKTLTNPDAVFYLISAIVQNIITIFTVLLFVKGSFKARVNALKLDIKKDSFKLFGLGCAAAVFAILLVALLGIITGVTKYEGFGFTSSGFMMKILLLSFMTSLSVGFGEEILFRGYNYTTLSKSGGKYWAVIISALIFMLMHVGTYTKLLEFIDVFLAGVLLAVMYIKSNSLYLSIGFHFVWDFTQFCIFRLEKSSYFDAAYIFKFKVPKDVHIFGFNIGCEYEIIFIAVILILIFLVLKVYPNFKNKALSSDS